MLLGPDDPLPHCPTRVIAIGASGSGKTTLAVRLGEVLGLPHTEIDALHHGPNWVPRSEFLDDVRALAASEQWVTEWQYASARPILTASADLAVWLDLPRRMVMRQVIRRTLRRRLKREELWNGNREGPLWRVLVDDEHIVRWAWNTYGLYPGRVETIQRERPELPVVRLRSRSDVETWLRRIATDAGGRPGPPR